MKIELERQIMDVMYLSRQLQNRTHLRFSEISNLSGLKKSSLQTILPRLVDRGWIKEIQTPSYSTTEPLGKVGKMIWVMGKNRQGERRQILLPTEIIEEYDKKYPELKRTKTKFQFKYNEPEIEVEYLKDYLKSIDPKKRKRILRDHSLSFRGRTKLLRDIFKEGLTRDLVFYRLSYYPYLHRISGGYMKSEEDYKIIPPWDVPKGKNRFWQNAANDIKKLRKRWKDVFVRENLLPKIRNY